MAEFEETLGRIIGGFLREALAPLQRRIEQLETENVDFRAHLKALKDRKTATAGMALTGKSQHDVARH